MGNEIHLHPQLRAPGIFRCDLSALLADLIPMALDHFSLLPVRLDPGFVLVVRLFSTLGPACSAILVSLLFIVRAAVHALFGQLKRWWAR
jgi:hypothetical protein